MMYEAGCGRVRLSPQHVEVAAELGAYTYHWIVTKLEASLSYLRL